MDWNRDGKTDGYDSALFHSEINNDGGKSSGGSSGGGGSPGHYNGCSMVFWSLVFIGVVIYQIIKWIAGLF